VKEEPRIYKHFRFAGRGWVAGALAALVVGLIWPAVFPAIVRVNHYYGAGPGLALILVFTILLATPPALLGGLVGAAVSREGGEGSQRTAALVGGIVAALPFACGILWFFTGW
jgi:hypothetical protein